LAKGDVDGLGRIFDAAHGLLSALRLSTPELDALVHGARAAGAVGAKLTGAGGGGAVIALAPGHEGDVLARWRRDGFTGFSTQICSNDNSNDNSNDDSNDDSDGGGAERHGRRD